ncbi:MAG: amidase family protein, partial [Myxococcota bacterium]
MTRSTLTRRRLLQGAGAASLAAGCAKRTQYQAALNTSLPDDPYFADATSLMAAMRAGAVSSVELTQMYLDRIDALQPTIHAIAIDMREQALEHAKAADASRRAGEDKPLLGLPMTVKESFDIAGQVSSWGNPEFKDAVMSEDSEVVRRLRNAGAVLMGKTNVPVMLSTYEAENPIYGRTNNPYDASRNPGGSSGGAAAALASGQTGLECGSDLGGSIRQPAYSCGLYGLKPTWGVISQRGHVPPMLPREAAHLVDSPTLSQMPACGPLARSANDIELAMRVLGGTRGSMGRAYRWQWPKPRAVELENFRVGFVFDHPAASPDENVAPMLQKLLNELQRAGANVVEGWPAGIDPIRLRDLRFYHRA